MRSLDLEEAIRSRLTETGMTQLELQERLGFDDEQIQFLMEGNHGVNLYIASRLAEELGLPIDYWMMTKDIMLYSRDLSIEETRSYERQLPSAKASGL